jgi:hypothetical protein
MKTILAIILAMTACAIGQQVVDADQDRTVRVHPDLHNRGMTVRRGVTVTLAPAPGVTAVWTDSTPWKTNSLSRAVTFTNGGNLHFIAHNGKVLVEIHRKK